MRVTHDDQQRSSRPVSERGIWLALVVLAFAAGVIVARAPRTGLWLAQVGRWAAQPRAALRAWRAYRALPLLQLDVGFADYQQWRAATPGDAAATACVPAQVRWSDDARPSSAAVNVTLCPPPDGEAAGEVHPTFDLAAVDPAAPLPAFAAMPWARLEPATPDQVGMDPRAALRSLDLPALPAQWVRVTVNGSRWGLYRMTALPTPEVLVAAGLDAASRVVSFVGQAQPEVPAAVSSFAYARAVVSDRAADTLLAQLVPEPADAAAADVAAGLRAAVAARLWAVERGEVVPVDAFDADVLGRYLAVTTLWYGAPALDWQYLYLAYDPATERFTPLATGSPPQAGRALPAAFTADPQVQRAYAAWLSDLSAPDTFAALLAAAEAAAPPDLIAGLEGAAALREQLEAHHAQVRRLLAAPPLRAEAAEDGDRLLVRLSNPLPFPVEVLGLDCSELGFVPLDPDWVQTGDAAALVTGAGGVVLRAGTGDAPVGVVAAVPVGALPERLGGATAGLQVAARIWGLEARRQVSVERGLAPAWGVYD